MRKRFDFTLQKLFWHRLIKCTTCCFFQVTKLNQFLFALHHWYPESGCFAVLCFVKALQWWWQFQNSGHVPADSIGNGWPYDPVCTDYLQHCKVITLVNKLCKENSVICSRVISIPPDGEINTAVGFYCSCCCYQCLFAPCLLSCILVWQEAKAVCLSVFVIVYVCPVCVRASRV